MNNTESCMMGVFALLLAIALIPLGIAAGYYLSAPVIVSLLVLALAVALWMTRRDGELDEFKIFAEMFAVGLILGSIGMIITAIVVRWDKIEPWLSSTLLR